MDAHLQPIQHTVNDEIFLYMPSFFDIEADIGFAVEKGKNVETTKSKLMNHLYQLENYLKACPYEQALESINENIKIKSRPSLCYVCLEVQSVQLAFPTKNLSVHI